MLKVDRVQNEAMRAIPETTKDTPIETTRFMLELPPMQTRQKVEQVKAYFSAIKKSPQPTPRSRERHKGMQTGMGQVLDGPSRGLNTASMPADRAQANQGVGKVPKSIPASLRDTAARKTWESTIENGQQAKQCQRSSFSFNETANRKTS